MDSNHEEEYMYIFLSCQCWDNLKDGEIILHILVDIPLPCLTIRLMMSSTVAFWNLKISDLSQGSYTLPFVMKKLRDGRGEPLIIQNGCHQDDSGALEQKSEMFDFWKITSAADVTSLTWRKLWRQDFSHWVRMINSWSADGSNWPILCCFAQLPALDS